MSAAGRERLRTNHATGHLGSTMPGCERPERATLARVAILLRAAVSLKTFRSTCCTCEGRRSPKWVTQTVETIFATGLLSRFRSVN